MPVQETADGIDRAARRRSCRSAASGQPGPATGPRHRGAQPRSSGAPSTRPSVAGRARGGRDRRRTPTSSTASLEEAPRPRRAARARGRAARARRGARRADVRAAAAGRRDRPRRPLRARRRAARPGDGVTRATRAARTQPTRRAAGRRHRHRAGARRRRAPRRPGPRIIVCCGVGRGRQDHDRGRAGAACRRARTQGGRAHDRPGPAAGPVDGHRGAGQHPAAGARAIDAAAGGSLDAMMLDMKRTFDEVVESQASPEKAAQILANPFYSRRLELVRRHPGVHGDGEARAAPPDARRRAAGT